MIKVFCFSFLGLSIAAFVLSMYSAMTFETTDTVIVLGVIGCVCALIAGGCAMTNLDFQSSMTADKLVALSRVAAEKQQEDKQIVKE